MQITTLLWILGAGVIALAFALFQYFYKAKHKTARNKVYAILRFLSVFGLLLLLINPKYKQQNYYTEKPVLPIAFDNSASIEFLGYNEKVKEAVVRFRESAPLNKAFDLQYFEFGSELSELDTLNFDQKQTNIAKVLSSLNTIYKDEVAPTVIITDGNQTLGETFKYTARNNKQPLYTVAVGDTVVYDDLKLGQVNVNRYAYINNKFPVEVFANYNGDNEVQSRLLIQSAGRTIHRETIRFSPQESSKVFNVLLSADAVGVRQFRVSLEVLSSEKNTSNNSKNFAIEVIDQKTNVAIISDVMHPDLGMLKKSIQSNRLRSADILKPADSYGKLNDYQLVVLFQPTRNFSTVYKELDDLAKNSITISGPDTDWNFLNGVQTVVRRELTGQTEEVQAVVQRNFSSFLIEDIGFEDFPPLATAFGEVVLNGEVDVAQYQRVGNVATDTPLLLTSDQNGRRGVYLLGSGIWRWRAQSYVDSKSFEDFDNFMDKLVQYAASNKKKSRLNIDYESFYYGNGSVLLYAQYFDKNYVFDARAALNIRVVNSESKEVYQAPFLLQKNGYQVDLSNLPAGDYSFTVSVQDQGLARSGTFTIVPFNVEQQFLNADVAPLRDVASLTGGSYFTIDQVDGLVNSLINDPRYRPVQKSSENIVPLIDWRWLLGLLTLLLAIEWFMRKYNGLT